MTRLILDVYEVLSLWWKSFVKLAPNGNQFFMPPTLCSDNIDPHASSTTNEDRHSQIEIVQCIIKKKKKILCPQLQRSWQGILVSCCPCVCACMCLFVTLFDACHILWTVHARVLKFHRWIPHGKIADPYFFSCPSYLPFWSYAPLKKSDWNLVSKISWKLFELGAWNLVSW